MSTDIQLYTVAETSKRLHVSVSRVYQLIHAGQITPRKIGRLTLIPHAELSRFVESLPVDVGPPPVSRAPLSSRRRPGRPRKFPTAG